MKLDNKFAPTLCLSRISKINFLNHFNSTLTQRTQFPRTLAIYFVKNLN